MGVLKKVRFRRQEELTCRMVRGYNGPETTVRTEMASISPENERFIEQEIAAGRFRDISDAIDAGIGLLRRQKELLNRIDEGRRQLDSGGYREYDETTLSTRFDELKEQARKIGRDQSQS